MQQQGYPQQGMQQQGYPQQGMQQQGYPQQGMQQQGYPQQGMQQQQGCAFVFCLLLFGFHFLSQIRHSKWAATLPNKWEECHRSR
jgi:hypothetical protein